MLITLKLRFDNLFVIVGTSNNNNNFSNNIKLMYNTTIGPSNLMISINLITNQIIIEIVNITFSFNFYSFIYY